MLVAPDFMNIQQNGTGTVPLNSPMLCNIQIHRVVSDGWANKGELHPLTPLL